MEERNFFPILSQITKAFLEIPDTSTSSERILSCSGKRISSRTVRPKPHIVLPTMSIAENVEVPRKHHEEVVCRVNNPTILYLSETVKQTSAVDIDVGQDILS